jgi:hypothetical protein
MFTKAKQLLLSSLVIYSVTQSAARAAENAGTAKMLQVPK